MKKLYLVFVLCLVMLFSSCNALTKNTETPGIVTTHPELTTYDEDNVTTNPAEGGTDSVIYDDYFDTDCLKKPTVAAVAEIYEGMGITEIIERIGKPHDMGPFSGVPSLEWEISDGTTCCIVFSIAQDAPKNISDIERLFQYGVAVRVIISES